LKEIWNYERWNAPEQHGPRWFYTHNDGLQNQSVLLVAADPRRAARAPLDPNEMSKDGTLAIKDIGYSDDSRLMAYGLSEAGSDWEVWRVRDVASGRDLAMRSGGQNSRVRPGARTAADSITLAIQRLTPVNR
jgi:prolyl oligopeptidase